MTNIEAIKALTEIKTYVSAVSLDAVDYAVKVLQNLENAGIKNPSDESEIKGAAK